MEQNELITVYNGKKTKWNPIWFDLGVITKREYDYRQKSDDTKSSYRLTTNNTMSEKTLKNARNNNNNNIYLII